MVYVFVHIQVCNSTIIPLSMPTISRFVQEVLTTDVLQLVVLFECMNYKCDKVYGLYI